VVRRHGDFTRSIHLRHLPQKLQTMIRPTFQHIELPLMDHFMSQSVEQLLLRVRCPIGELFKEWERKSNLTMTASHSERMECLGTFTTGKHPHRGGQALAPHDLYRHERIGKVPRIQVPPF
jgi:hypothetical protein